MTDQSAAGHPGAQAWRAIEPYWECVDIYGDPEDFLSGFRLLPEPIGHLLAAWWCNSEVCNGGFHQFFSNSTGVLAPEALLGYRTMGATRCAELVDAAVRQFGAPFPRGVEARLGRLAELEGPGDRRSEWDPFYSLDDQYYAAKRQENLLELMDRYAHEFSGSDL